TTASVRRRTATSGGTTTRHPGTASNATPSRQPTVAIQAITVTADKHSVVAPPVRSPTVHRNLKTYVPSARQRLARRAEVVEAKEKTEVKYRSQYADDSDSEMDVQTPTTSVSSGQSVSSEEETNPVQTGMKNAVFAAKLDTAKTLQLKPGRIPDEENEIFKPRTLTVYLLPPTSQSRAVEPMDGGKDKKGKKPIAREAVHTVTDKREAASSDEKDSSAQLKDLLKMLQENGPQRMPPKRMIANDNRSAPPTDNNVTEQLRELLRRLKANT
ncbi:hypothetical protein SCHPADRAFT_897612, partial [Schizopora paradoxa]